jgi:linoleoyl-CoA desaturase
VTETSIIPNLTRAIMPSDTEIRWARRRLHAKALSIVAMAVLSYWGLVIADNRTLVRLGCTTTLILAIVAVATGIMHDANHGAFSSSRRVNRIVGYTLDVLGGSSWLWRFKHNTLHHGNTNVVGVDSDIDQGPVARLAPQQQWRPWHRYQHVYLWFVYGLLAIRWFLMADFMNLVKNSIGAQPLPAQRRRRDVVYLIVGKLVHLTWAVIVPLLFNPWWGVLAFYLVSSWIVGFMLATVFQMAHCVDAAEFVDEGTSCKGKQFQMHQINTTVDIRFPFPPLRWMMRWLIGGLDHQVVHHLAPMLPHTLYPRMRRRLEAACLMHGVTLRTHMGMFDALRSHVRWLKLMGQQPAVLMVAPVEASKRQ